MTYAKGAKHLCTTAAANALAIQLRQRGLEKNRWNFMIWAVFLQKTHACRDIYTYTNERETDFNEVSQIRTYPGTTQCHCHFETNLAYHPIQKRKV